MTAFSFEEKNQAFKENRNITFLGAWKILFKKASQD